MDAETIRGVAAVVCAVFLVTMICWGLFDSIRSLRRPRRDCDSRSGHGSVVVDDPDPVLRAVVEECWRTGESVEWRDGDPLPGAEAPVEGMR